ncbi:unnamed protein product [Meloidogyne enterolobii]|uniref:Uncharacterized protein n=1 Tax=Meloidogyne enterolobii TaxID=390850 RepID=A0ACB1AWC1_MELEN
MLDRFSEENIIGNYCSQNIEKGASTSSTSQQQSSKSLPSITSAISEKSSKKRKRVLSTSESSSESSASICITPLKNFYSERGPKGRFKKRSDSFKSNEEITTPSFEQNFRGRAISFHVGSNKLEKGPTSKALSSSQKEILVDIDCSSLITPKLVPNGLHPRLNSLNKNTNLSNGIIGNKSSQNGGKQQKQLRKGTPIIKKQKSKNKIFGKSESNLKNCFKLMSEEDDDFDEEEEDKEEIVAEEEEEEDGEELMEKSMRGVNGNNGTNDRKHWTKSSTATTSNDKDPDNEISVLLRKKQERLRELFYKSRPTIETLYARVLKEYAVHEAIHKMDEADNKVF